MSCRDCDKRDAALVDLSSLFSSVPALLRELVTNVAAIGGFVAKIATKERFTLLAGGSSEMPLQKGRNGTVRQIVNLTNGAINVYITDGLNTQLLGSSATLFPIAANAVQPLWLPFKNGLRVYATGAVSVSGELTFF